MRATKKVILGILVLCLTLVGLLIPTQALAASDNGTDGEIQWKISGSTLTLSAVKGTQGKMKDYTQDIYPPWTKASSIKNVNTVIISDGITTLGTFANLNIKNLEKLEIAGTVKTIPSGFCFYGTSIDTVLMKEGVKTIEDSAFMASVSTAVLPKSLENIAVDSFVIPDGDCAIYTLKNVCGYRGSKAIEFVEACNERLKIGMRRLADINGKEQKSGSIRFDSLDDGIVAIIPKEFWIPINESESIATIAGNISRVKVTYKSSNEKVAVVSSAGTVTGKSNGAATITTTVSLSNGTTQSFATAVTIE